MLVLMLVMVMVSTTWGLINVMLLKGSFMSYLDLVPEIRIPTP